MHLAVSALTFTWAVGFYRQVMPRVRVGGLVGTLGLSLGC